MTKKPATATVRSVDSAPGKSPHFIGRAARTLGSLTRETLATIRAGSSMTYQKGEDWIVGAKRAVYGLAVARMLIAIMFIGTALSNWSTRNYTFGPGVAWSGQIQFPASSFATIWPFSLVTGAAHNSTAVTLVFVSLIVCSILFGIGYRSRLVMFPLFVLWVGMVNMDLYVQDQSDNLSRMAMISMFFTAPAQVWSVDAWRRRRFVENPNDNFLRKLWRFQPVLPTWVTNIFHNFAIVIIGAQLCMVYASGGLFKAGGLPWQNGTAIYAPIHTRQFGTWPVLTDIVTAWGPMVALGTIGTVLVQVAFPLMLLRRGTRILALVTIFGFHVVIAVLMGLPWFSVSMLAFDAIFIRDITWAGMGAAVVAAWRRTGQKSVSRSPGGGASGADGRAGGVLAGSGRAAPPPESS